ncbi:MAG: HNH endonuclease signature motif containing protein [Elusimicrobiota bacterium]
MQKRSVTKAQIKKERDPEKVAKVIKQKGYPSGELPRGKVLHHIKPVAIGGKTTKKNARIITNTKHKQIHKNRAVRGKI